MNAQMTIRGAGYETAGTVHLSLVSRTWLRTCWIYGTGFIGKDLEKEMKSRLVATLARRSGQNAQVVEEGLHRVKGLSEEWNRFHDPEMDSFPTPVLT
jgi:hypothetical protein